MQEKQSNKKHSSKSLSSFWLCWMSVLVFSLSPSVHLHPSFGCEIAFGGSIGSRWWCCSCPKPHSHNWVVAQPQLAFGPSEILKTIIYNCFPIFEKYSGKIPTKRVFPFDFLIFRNCERKNRFLKLYQTAS